MIVSRSHLRAPHPPRRLPRVFSPPPQHTLSQLMNEYKVGKGELYTNTSIGYPNIGYKSGILSIVYRYLRTCET